MRRHPKLCKEDQKRLCGGVGKGGGKIEACMFEHRSRLTFECRNDLATCVGRPDYHLLGFTLFIYFTLRRMPVLSTSPSAACPLFWVFIPPPCAFFFFARARLSLGSLL